MTAHAFGYQEKRSHAAWREMPSACPITAQGTSRFRKTATVLCSPVPAFSNTAASIFNQPSSVDIELQFFEALNSGRTRRSGASGGAAMIRLHSPTHSLQMNTLGPARRTRRYHRYRHCARLLRNFGDRMC